MAKYDLTNGLETSFTFNINDKEFVFNKPTVREMRELAKGFSAIDNEKDEEKQVEMSANAMKGLYKFVKPVGHETGIDGLLEDLPVSVQVSFNEMIKKELGVAE